MTQSESPINYHGDPAILTWGEGDEITDAHLQAMVDHCAYRFGQNEEWKAKELSRLKGMSNPDRSAEIAGFIAAVKGMSLEEFTRSFPSVAADSNSDSVNLLIDIMSRMSALRTRHNKGEL